MSIFLRKLLKFVIFIPMYILGLLQFIKDGFSLPDTSNTPVNNDYEFELIPSASGICSFLRGDVRRHRDDRGGRRAAIRLAFTDADKQLTFIGRAPSRKNGVALAANAICANILPHSLSFKNIKGAYLTITTYDTMSMSEIMAAVEPIGDVINKNCVISVETHIDESYEGAKVEAKMYFHAEEPESDTKQMLLSQL